MHDRHLPWPLLRASAMVMVGLAPALAGCASRPINPPRKEADRGYGYRTEGQAIRGAASDTMVVLAFSGGSSFTALAYGLHGEKLFAEYEWRFLRRDVHCELLARLLAPANWPSLWSEDWGRSRRAAASSKRCAARHAS